MVRSASSNLKDLAALEGYTIPAASRKLKVDLDELRKKVDEISGKSVISEEEYEGLKTPIQNAYRECKEKGLSLLSGWFADALATLQKKVVGREISTAEYTSSYNVSRKHAREAFRSLLKRRFGRIAYFPEKFGKKLPEGAVLVSEYKEKFELFRNIEGNKFYFVGRFCVKDKGKAYDLGERVIGVWIVEP